MKPIKILKNTFKELFCRQMIVKSKEGSRPYGKNFVQGNVMKKKQKTTTTTIFNN
jgi:hypothetical protein